MALCLALPVCAEDESHRSMNPHMIRIGWGDQHFEHVVWHATPQPMNKLPETYSAKYSEHFRYTQHWSAEYQYRFNRWFSLGGLVDGSGVMWDDVIRNGLGNEMSRTPDRCVFNIVAMPTIYFTYLHHEYVSLHSGLGAGFNINGGTYFSGGIQPYKSMAALWYHYDVPAFPLGVVPQLVRFAGDGRIDLPQRWTEHLYVRQPVVFCNYWCNLLNIQHYDYATIL